MKTIHKNNMTARLICMGQLTSMVILASMTTHANDSTGYVGTGGVEYIKNKNISMHSEDLYLSKNEVRVNYEFKNLSHQDITETILFPMPAVPSSRESDYADTTATYDNFKIWVNGQSITPDWHVRTFMSPIIFDEGYKTYADTSIDTTAISKACGISDADMMAPWTSQVDVEAINQKLLACDNKALEGFIYDKTEPYLFWDSQVIYSWKQTFKAKATTKIKHTYAPLVGGSVHLDSSQYDDFCVDNAIKRSLMKYEIHPYRALSYVLTTGANWAKPIGNFKLTVERDPNELVSFCWKGKGKIKKIAPTTFEIKETNFVPTHDFDVAFISRIDNF